MYKKAILPTLLLLLFATLLPAQWTVVTETERVMSFGSRPCFRMEFSNADDDLVADIWKDFAKKNFGAKLKKGKKDEMSATNLKSGILGNDPFTLYSMVEKNGDNAALNVWFDAGSYFLNRRDNPGRTEEVNRVLRQFYFDVRRAVIGQELKAAEDKLKDMEKQQRSLQKDNEGLRKDIESWKEKIQKAEQDIVANEKNQEKNIVDQDAQRRAIEEVRQRLNNVENEKN
jgi:hypothetical protein